MNKTRKSPTNNLSRLVLAGCPILFLTTFLYACGTPCAPPSPEDKPGIYSRVLGSVQIDNEICQIIETYEMSNCSSDPDSAYYCRYYRDGERHRCHKVPLTRITKCPSNTTSNKIGESSDKFHRETIE